MPSRRADIAMNMDEIRAYLIAQPRLIIVSNGVGGYPHPIPMNFALDDQDRLLVLSFAKSQKVLNFERDPRASLLVESGFEYAELKSVIIYAEAEIIRDEAEKECCRSWFAKKAQTPLTPGSARADQVAAAQPKRVVIRFTPHKYVSWDHSKLVGRY